MSNENDELKRVEIELKREEIKLKKLELKIREQELSGAQKVRRWKEPLLRILEGHEDLLKITSEFPRTGPLPDLVDIPEFEIMKPVGLAESAAAAAIVVVVVCVAVAARPGAVTTPELLRAKLLDVYSPTERDTLAKAISIVRDNPKLVKKALGVSTEELGQDFMGRLDQVEKALQH